MASPETAMAALSLNPGDVFDAKDMEVNAGRYCPRCREMVSFPKQTQANTLWDGKGWFEHRSMRFEWKKCVLCRKLQAALKGDLNMVQDLEFYTMEGEFSHPNLPTLRLAPDFNADGIFTAAREQMKACRASHKKCRGTAEATSHPALPTRVIDIGTEPNAIPYLHVSTAPGAVTSAPYACLSYCWGHDQLKTKQATLEKYTLALPVSELSKTIQDAITVTRRIGMRYLWVDALCIVQDSPEDQGREISKMGDIYRHASITIAAASASAASVGFLDQPARPPPSLAMDVRVPAPDGTQGTGQMGRVYAAPGSAFRLHADAYKVRNPLENRGWVMQEFLLSPRLLIFSSLDVAWRCQTGDPVGLLGHTPMRWDSLAKSARLPPGAFGAGGLAGGLSLSEWISGKNPLGAGQLRTWQLMVCDFTARGLTEQTDKIAAMAGIVGELKKVFKDEYSYGLWHRLGAEGLCWSALKPGKRIPIAPTWSWCSVDAPLTFTSPTDDLLSASIVTYPPQPDLAAKMDMKNPAVLKVKGKLITPENLPEPAKKDDAGDKREYFLDIVDTPQHVGAYYLFEMGQTYWFKGSGMHSKWTTMWFLVLLKVGENTFEKRGIMRHHSNDGLVSSKSPFHNVLKKLSKVTIELV